MLFLFSYQNLFTSKDISREKNDGVIEMEKRSLKFVMHTVESRL